MSGKKTIRLGFAGDLMLGGEPLRYAQQRGLALTYPFEALMPALRGLDLLLINLVPLWKINPHWSNECSA